MHILLKADDFLNIPSLISLILGILLGFILLLLVYLLAVIKNMRRKMKSKKVQEEDIDFKEVEWLINNATNDFKELEKEKPGQTIKNVTIVSKDLAVSVASKFYPRSKHPLRELTIDETIVLTHYITKRVDELMDASILRLFRGMTISQIASLKEKTEKVTESKVYKTAKEAKLDKFLKSLRYANPIYWIKKLTIDQAIKVIIKKICLNTIVITGEETYKIYSKKLFKTEDNEIDFAKIYQELEKEGE